MPELQEQQNEIQILLLVDARWVGVICDVAIAALTACKPLRCVEVTQAAAWKLHRLLRRSYTDCQREQKYTTRF
jgi:hypothetical protein